METLIFDTSRLSYDDFNPYNNKKLTLNRWPITQEWFAWKNKSTLVFCILSGHVSTNSAWNLWRAFHWMQVRAGIVQHLWTEGKGTMPNAQGSHALWYWHPIYINLCLEHVVKEVFRFWLFSWWTFTIERNWQILQ